MKNKIVFLFVVIVVICLSACFSPWMNEDEAVVTIRLNQSRAVRSSLPWPPQDYGIILDYKITLTSETDKIDLTANGTDEVIEITVPAGFYEIKVDAYFTRTGTASQGPNGEIIHYATGDTTADLRAGRNNPVTVPMHPVNPGSLPVNALPPDIIAQPESRAYTRDALITLSVTAISPDEGDLTYQWYSNDENINNGGAKIDGAVLHSYNPPNSENGTFHYYVVITNTIEDNDDGGVKTASVTSDVAVITINDAVNALPPDITAQPEGGTFPRNTEIMLSVTADSLDGGELTYQWYSNNINTNSGGTMIPDETEAEYNPPGNITGIFHYYVVVTNTIEDNEDGGEKTAGAVSNVITVEINPPVNAQAPNITAQPSGGIHPGNAAVTLSVTATSPDDGNLTYQWYSNSSATNNGGTAIGGATNASFSPSSADAGTFYYYVIVTNNIDNNSDGGNKTTVTASDAITVIINPPVNALQPVINSQPQSNTFTRGAEISIHVTATSPDDGNLTYQWYSNTSAINSGGIAIAEETEAEYNPPGNTDGTFYYYVVIKNTIFNNQDGGNKTADTASDAVTITINNLVNAQLPDITELSGSGTYARGAPVTLSVTAISPDDGDLTYQWFSNDTNSNNEGTIVTAATDSNYNPPNNIAGTFYYYVVITNTIFNNQDGGNKVVSTPGDVIEITVDKSEPEIITWPIAAGITYGAALSTSDLTREEVNTSGSFAWTDGTIIPTVNNNGYSVTFTPEDTDNYNSVTEIIDITVLQATPSVIWPSSLTANYVQTLADVILPDNGSGTPGTFSWIEETTTAVGGIGTRTHNLTFTPTDTDNYITVTQDVDINVTQVTLSINVSSPVYSNNHTVDGVTRNALTPVLSRRAPYSDQSPYTERIVTFTVAVSGFINTADATSIALFIPAVTGLTINGVGSNATTNSISTVAGITTKTFTITITYNGTQPFPTGTTNINISLSTVPHTGYISGGSQNVPVNIIDGQAAFTGTGVDRRIPLHANNIIAFNIYANSLLNFSDSGQSRHYKQLEHITIPIPAAGGSNWTSIYGFNGSYDGQLYTISGIINLRESQTNGGMFSSVSRNGTDTSTGVVKNLGLVNIYIRASSSTGGITGSLSNGIISNCFTTGFITHALNWRQGDNPMVDYGGIVGTMSGTAAIVQNCYSTVTINGMHRNVGGIVGRIYNGGTVQNCYATGSITTNNAEFDRIGGIAGAIDCNVTFGIVQNCYYAFGTITMNRRDGGGIVGHLNRGYIQNNVALNPRIVQNPNSTGIMPTYMGRVTTGVAFVPRIYNNYGLYGMIIVNDPVYEGTLGWQENGYTSYEKDGTNVTMAEATTQSWWTAEDRWLVNNDATRPAFDWDFSENGPWMWGVVNGRTLPVLRNMPRMP